MSLTEQEMGYNPEALRGSIKDCKKNIHDFNQFVHNDKSDKDTVITFMKRVNIEEEKIRNYERILSELAKLEK